MVMMEREAPSKTEQDPKVFLDACAVVCEAMGVQPNPSD